MMVVSLIPAQVTLATATVSPFPLAIPVLLYTLILRRLGRVGWIRKVRPRWHLPLLPSLDRLLRSVHVGIVLPALLSTLATGVVVAVLIDDLLFEASELDNLMLLV